MEAFSLNDTQITGGFWAERLALNAGTALAHQWHELEDSACIQNFRLAAGQAEGFREGWFFADSDAYKWLDAAARSLAHQPTPELTRQVEEFIALLEAAQAPDGYLYTYNQLHFPGVRWKNLQLEHECYCLGHLIEAGVSHYTATGEKRLLDVARRAADLLVKDFTPAGPLFTDGHEEIEIALLRLHQATGEEKYRELARLFLERRGRIPFFAWHFARQTSSTDRRQKLRNQQRAEYMRTHPGHVIPRMPSRLLHRVTRLLPLRLTASALSGKFIQQNAPIRKQSTPVGHAVRFTYLQTAAAMLARLSGDESLLPALLKSWERMVTRRMFVTGGLGALPLIEGFGRDYELDPELAYAETCAALGGMFWSWEMTLLTGQAQYADLFEWQLYNAASVSMALDGQGYFYDNPLASRGGLERSHWYSVPCCPSNLSRTWASLGTYLFSRAPGSLCLHQYASSRVSLEPGAHLSVESSLPWEGNVRLAFELDTPRSLALHLRIPSWTDGYTLRLNGEPFPSLRAPAPPREMEPTACGYDPRRASYLSIERDWQPGDRLEIEFSLPIRRYRQDRRIPNCGGKIALGRGPLIYCLESVDNPGVDIFDVQLDPAGLECRFEADLLGGCAVLRGESSAGQPLTFIPYMLWANRGPSQMNVFVKG